MGSQFLLPKDPRLSFRMLLPTSRRKHLRAPISGSRAHYLFWARNAIYHGVRALGIQPGENVLVPAYHCKSVVEPILQYGAEVKFYKVGLDLQADLSDISEKIDAKSRAVIAIHYFGFPQKIVEIKEFCQDRGLFLIEDCAHVLVGRTEQGIALGSSGDFSIFSWRKYLPLYDGGQLVINNPDLKLATLWEEGGALFAFKIAKNLLDKVMEDSSNGLVNWFGRMSHAPSVLFSRFAAATGGHHDSKRMISSYELEFDLASANLKMSRLSQYVMCNANIADISAKRRRNYQMLADEIKSMTGVVPVYASLPDNIVPWVFPVLAVGVKGLHLRLRERGVPATNWSGVISHCLPLDKFPDSRFLYENIIFLPVHQSLQKSEIKTMLRILGEVLGKAVKADAKSLDGRLSLSAL
jgi:perosamine synthetase